MQSQRQHFLLSYLKTLSVGPAGIELTTSHMAARCSTNYTQKSNCFNSDGTRVGTHVFRAVQKTRSRVLSGLNIRGQGNTLMLAF